MKRKIVLSVLLLISIGMYSHVSEVHQYMVSRAYLMLERRYVDAGGNIQDLQEIKSKIFNSDNSCCYGKNCKEHSLNRGARREDNEDPIYGLAYGFLTMTHFWDADNGKSAYVWSGLYPNSYLKSVAYLFANGGNYTWIVDVNLIRRYYYTINRSLVYFYNSQGECTRFNQVWPIGTVDREVVHYSNYKNVAYEILGRVAHLLADMSSPPHSHIDSHIELLGDADPYEQEYMANNGRTILNSPEDLDNDDGFMPFIVNNYSDATVILNLFTFTNQVTGFYPSKDYSGNNQYSGEEILKQKFTAWGQPLGANQGDNLQTAKRTYSFCIGQIATLLYWFGRKTGLLQTQIRDMKFNDVMMNPTATLHADNSITLNPGFEFSGSDLILTIEPVSTFGGRRVYAPPVQEYTPQTIIIFDSVPQNLPCDTIYTNE